MINVMETAAESQAEQARTELIQTLIDQGHIRSPQVEAAFRAVPREVFVPEGTPLDKVYAVDDAVATKRDEHGVIISAISATYIQALMIEQVDISEGMSVLEIGSGGYNAALLAEAVGPTGTVVSVDIDPEVVANAKRALHAAGYADRVEVVQADAEHGLDAAGPFDRIIVTVGAWDIAPAWLEQLTAAGVIVVPLRMNGITRTIAFRRVGAHLQSTSAQVAGFVAMQGDGAHEDKVLELPDGHGRHVRLRFDDHAPAGPHLLDGALAAGRATVWSGVQFPHRVSFADLHLWLACGAPGFCKVAADEGIQMAPAGGGWFPFGVVRGDSLAYLVTRKLPDDAGVEFGAAAFGAHAEHAATAMAEQIRAWDADARSGPGPDFAIWPKHTPDTDLPAGAAVIDKTYSRVTVSWPKPAR